MTEGKALKPLYIFDLDGTLSLAHHRQPILDNKDDSHRWDKFYDACDMDEPNESVIRVMESLRLFADVWIFSGRSARVRTKTVSWLTHNTSFTEWDLETALRMRDEGDHTPDDVLKQEWLHTMLIDDRRRLKATFDDRDRVVKMWRDNGLTCFQVAPGAF